MIHREIRIVGDPVLCTPCEGIRETDASIRMLVEDLLESIDMDGRTGFATNQIDMSKRTFSYDIGSETSYALDPHIVEIPEDEYQDGDKGCLSVPHLWYPTERAWHTCTEGIDLDDKEITLEGEKLMARCLQHEYGHPDDYIYIDRLDRRTHKKTLCDIRNQEW